MAVHIVTPQQTQTGTFAVVVWIIGGDARSSVAARDFTATIASGTTIPVDVVANTLESGQTRVIVAVTPPSGYRDRVTLRIPQNAFAIGTTRLPSEPAGITSAHIAFDTTASGADGITWTVPRAVFFPVQKQFTFEVVFSEMVDGDGANLSATSFSLTGATTSDVTVTNVNGAYTHYRISGTVTLTAREQVLNLNLAANGARRFVWENNRRAFSGYRFPDSDRLITSLRIPAMAVPVSPDEDEPRLPEPTTPVVETLTVTFAELPSAILKPDFSVVVYFATSETQKPIAVDYRNVTADMFEIRDGDAVIAGASITNIAPTIAPTPTGVIAGGAANWRKIHVRLPLGRTGAVYLRVLANSISWARGRGPAEDIDITPAISYDIPSEVDTPTQEDAEDVITTGPDETQNIAAAPVGGAAAGAFTGPGVAIIAPEAGQAIRISEYVDFDTELTHPSRLAYVNNEFYTFDTQTDALYHVTVADGTAERIGTATAFGVGETQPSTLFAFQDNLYLIGRQLRKVIRLDTTTGIGTLVSRDVLAVPNPLGAVVFQSHLLISAGNGNGLYEIDTSSWQAVPVPDNARYRTFNQMEENMNDLTVHQGKLYGIGDTNDTLFELDPVSGRAIPVNPHLVQFGLGLTTLQGLASDGKQLYATDATERALYTLRTKSPLPGETSELLFKFERPVEGFDRSDILFNWIDDDAPETQTDTTDGVILGELDPATGERGTSFQLPVYHKPNRSGVLTVAVLPGAARESREAQGTSSEPDRYGPPVPVSRRIPFKLTDTSVILSVPDRIVWTAAQFEQTATFTTDIQASSFQSGDVIIRTAGVSISNFRQSETNRRVFTWTLDFDITVDEIVHVGILAGSVRDIFGRRAPREDRFVAFRADQTAPDVSTAVAGATVLCEETFTIADNPFLQALIPDDSRDLQRYGGVFLGVLEYLKMEDLDRAYAVVQIGKPTISKDALDMRLPAAAVLVEIENRRCRVIETFEYALLAPRSLVQNGDNLHYFIGSHYAYEYLPQWTHPEPPDDVFVPPLFKKIHQQYAFSGAEITQIRSPIQVTRDEVEVNYTDLDLNTRSVLPDYFLRGPDAPPVHELLSQRGIFVTYDAKRKHEVSREIAWRSKTEDPVRMKGFTTAEGETQPIVPRRTPGYGIHGGMASPMVAEDGNVHLVPGYGDLRFIKSSRYRTRDRQANKSEPVTDIDNWQWLVYSKALEKRIPLLRTNGRTYYEVLKELAATFFCYLGYDERRNFVFKFKEPKQALLRNPVSNNMSPPTGHRRLALQLKRPNVPITFEVEKIVDTDIAGKPFAGPSGVYTSTTAGIVTHINLETGAADTTWDLSTFTLSTGTFSQIHRADAFFHGETLMAAICLTTGAIALYTVDLDAETLTLIGTRNDAISRVNRFFRGYTSFEGEIYGINSQSRELFRIVNGAPVLVGPMSGDADNRSRTNPFCLFALEERLWLCGRIQHADRTWTPYFLVPIDARTGSIGDRVDVVIDGHEAQEFTDYFGTSLTLVEGTLYSVKMSGLVKVGAEVMRYHGMKTDADGPLLLNVERAQRGTSMPNNHAVQPVYFIDYVISMTESYFVHPINRLDLRLDPSQVYNVIKIRYNEEKSEYVHDVSSPGDIRREFALSVPLDVHQAAIVRWLAERYANWYQSPQIVADAELKSAFYLSLGDVVLIEEPASIRDGADLFQVTALSHNVKGLTTSVKLRQIQPAGEVSEFGEVAETQLREGSAFSQTITRSNAQASIVAIPKGPLPTGVQVERTTGRVYGTPTHIPEAGQAFTVAYTEIIGTQFQEAEVAFSVAASRPPVWARDATYFFNQAAISIDLSSSYVSSATAVTFSVVGTAPAWLTLSGTTLSGTNPRTSRIRVTVRVTNLDGFADRDFIFDVATAQAPRWGTGDWGTINWGD